MRPARRILLFTALTLTLSACDWFRPKAPDIKFAPYSRNYQSKMDFAQVEHKYPLAPADLAKITPDNLAVLDQEQVDQIYSRLSAGPIPNGPYDGKVLLPRGTTGRFRPVEIATKTAAPTDFTLLLKGLAMKAAGESLQMSGEALEAVGESLWKGKVFFRDERVLRNRIEDLAALKKAGLVTGEPKKLSVNGKETWLLFPAKLYCGQSLMDVRRESVIIDYFFTDEISGYQEKPDFLAGRRGLRVRDEIRMVRPGFYLGRAYLDRVFGLSFTLYNKEVAERESDAFLKTGTVAEDCWTGTQRRLTASSK